MTSFVGDTVNKEIVDFTGLQGNYGGNSYDFEESVRIREFISAFCALLMGGK